MTAVFAKIGITVIKVVIGIAVLYLAFGFINWITAKLVGSLRKREHVDDTLVTSAGKVISVAGKVFVIILLIGYLGIDTSGLTALIASLGVCFGLAVNGAVANLAGGLLLLVTRPFRVGDFIEISGFTGTVQEIGLINTKILTLDNRSVYIPNGSVSSTSLINYNENGLRRIDMEYEIAYGADYKKAESVINDILSKDERILAEPAPTVRIAAHKTNGMTVCCRPWVKQENYWDVYFDLEEGIKTAFDENGIEIPFQQVDVRIKEK